jgi:hypothetical protein
MSVAPYLNPGKIGLLAPGRAVPETADPCCPWLPDFITILPPPGPATLGVVPNGVVALLLE